MFGGCSGLTNVKIPNSVTEICEGAFNECSGLTSVAIPNSVIEIGNSAFSGCSGLSSVAISNSVTHIGSYAFNGCESLTSVTIPNSIEKIDQNAFKNCTALSELYSLNAIPPTIDSNTFDTNLYMTLKVYVPKGSLKAYQEANGWKDFWNMAEGNPTGINQITTDNNSSSNIYDLRGNKIYSPKHGINIINDKKVVVK